MELRQMSLLALKTLNREIVAEIRSRQKKEQSDLATQFHVGQKVVFIARGRAVKGVIQRCNPTTASVQEDNSATKWSVPYSFLTAIAREGRSTNSTSK